MSKVDIYNRPAPIEAVIKQAELVKTRFKPKYEIENPQALANYKEMDDVCNIIIADSELNMPTITENDFKAVLWPQIIANALDQDQTQCFITWTKIAGELDRPIKVVKLDKTVLFVLPPMVEPYKTELSRLGGGVGAAIQSYLESKNHRPRKAEEDLRRAFDKHINSRGTGKAFMEIYPKLAEIYGGLNVQTAEVEQPQNTTYVEGDDVEEL